jgi:hypothetical protein
MNDEQTCHSSIIHILIWSKDKCYFTVSWVGGKMKLVLNFMELCYDIGFIVLSVITVTIIHTIV